MTGTAAKDSDATLVFIEAPRIVLSSHWEINLVAHIGCQCVCPQFSLGDQFGCAHRLPMCMSRIVLSSHWEINLVAHIGCQCVCPQFSLGDQFGCAHRLPMCMSSVLTGRSTEQQIKVRQKMVRSGVDQIRVASFSHKAQRIVKTLHVFSECAALWLYQLVAFLCHVA
ncbi:hypothetical protein RRG08_061195 [Elysia crispata]|uniref:Uncharacterized protein n=1 Tax=Elysia crispata TaxID=231223 RepID=A0AAE1DIR5_9GAST|nr:hypothetical protein RRG08_061195 [Elysia crispata]